jgi:hypothetical protein
MQRGIGDSKKAEQLTERAQKDEIIGRITHLYNVRCHFSLANFILMFKVIHIIFLLT